MKKDSIYISGYFCEENEKNIEECEKQLQDINVVLCKHDLSGEIYHSALDFMDLEMVAFSYELLRNFISSGSYDLFKSIVLKLWVNIFFSSILYFLSKNKDTQRSECLLLILLS